MPTINQNGMVHASLLIFCSVVMLKLLCSVSATEVHSLSQQSSRFSVLFPALLFYSPSFLLPISCFLPSCLSWLRLRPSCFSWLNPSYLSWLRPSCFSWLNYCLLPPCCFLLALTLSLGFSVSPYVTSQLRHSPSKNPPHATP